MIHEMGIFNIRKADPTEHLHNLDITYLKICPTQHGPYYKGKIHKASLNWLVMMKHKIYEEINTFSFDKTPKI